jgi:hypothetical protein
MRSASERGPMTKLDFLATPGRPVAARPIAVVRSTTTHCDEPSRAALGGVGFYEIANAVGRPPVVGICDRAPGLLVRRVTVQDLLTSDLG